MKSKFFVSMLSLMAAVLLLAACRADVESFEIGQYDTNVYMKICGYMHEPELINSSYKYRDLKKKYISLPNYINGTYTTSSLISQNGKIIYQKGCSMVVDDETPSFAYKYYYNGEGKVNTDRPHDLYIGGNWSRDGDNIFIRRSLDRNGNYDSYLVKHLDTSDMKYTPIRKNNGVVEQLFIVNNTNAPIQFSHHGFEARELWYYEYAEYTFEVNPRLVNSRNLIHEAYSDTFTVSARGDTISSRINSYYAPNGKPIKDATLVAYINGQEYRTVNTLSSDMQLKFGDCIGIVVIWDGNELRFAEDTEEQNMSASVIDLPEEATVKLDELTLIGNAGEMELGEDGTFESNSSTLSLVNKNDELVYFSLAATGERRPCNIKLGAMETAASLVLEAIPGFFNMHDKDDVLKLKLMVSTLNSTKSLANAIDKSVVRNGYLNDDEIMSEYAAAVHELYGKLGINTSAKSRRKTPIVTPSLKESNAYGLLVRLKDSKWKSDGKKGYWQCEFDIFSNRKKITS